MTRYENKRSRSVLISINARHVYIPSIAQRKRTSKDTKQETQNKTVEHNRGLSSASLRSIKIIALRAVKNESQKTLNKCKTRNKTVFHTRLRHPETINSVVLNSVLRIKQIGV